MKVAVIHWWTPSVGGINTTLEAYRAVAEAKGDTFHVLAAGGNGTDHKTKHAGLLPERTRIPGGDSFIWIDGYTPYAPNNVAESVAFINANYDVVMLSFICPHPSKGYGYEPKFMPLIEGIRLPIIGYVHDAYWDTYAEWAELVLPHCVKTLVAQKAYGEPLKKLGYAVQPVYLPFIAHTPLQPRKIVRDAKSVVWIPQWKNIKGIYPFLKEAPRLVNSGYHLDLFNNGIEYYKYRLTPAYRELVGDDHFAPAYNGTGKARFYGCIPLDQIEHVLQSASFMCDFQGAKAKYEAYKNGSYNHTVLEALYFGAVPVVHVNMLFTMPEELVLAVSDLSTYPEAIAGYADTAARRKRAREYVLDNYSAEKLYDRIFKGLRRKGK